MRILRPYKTKKEREQIHVPDTLLPEQKDPIDDAFLYFTVFYIVSVSLFFVLGWFLTSLYHNKFCI